MSRVDTAFSTVERNGSASELFSDDRKKGFENRSKKKIVSKRYTLFSGVLIYLEREKRKRDEKLNDNYYAPWIITR